MGVKKSTVNTSPSLSSRRYTAASSPVEDPTSRSGCSTWGSLLRTFTRSCWLSLAAQPAQWESSVSLTGALTIAALLCQGCCGHYSAGGSLGVGEDAGLSFGMSDSVNIGVD